MLKIPFPNNHFDAVICINTIEHNTRKNLKKTIGEIYRIMRKKGILLVTCVSPKDDLFGKGKKIEKMTYDIPGRDIHHFLEKKEIPKMFSEFKLISIKEVSHDRKGRTHWRWDILAEK